MPWCPKCKNEYRSGIQTCSECNVELVDSLSDITEDSFSILFTTEDKSLIDKFSDYLNYSGLTKHKVSVDSNDLIWTLEVIDSDYKEAKKLYRGFAITESENAVLEAIQKEAEEHLATDSIEPTTIDEEPEMDQDEMMRELHGPSSNFVRKAEQYEDYKFSAITCIFFGIVGIVYTILNMISVLSMVTLLFSQLVMLVVFIGFLITGLIIYKNSKKIATLIDSESKLEDALKDWLEQNVTVDYINSLRDESLSDEINYFNYCEMIRENITKNIPSVSDSMLEAIIDEHLTTLNI